MRALLIVLMLVTLLPVAVQGQTTTTETTWSMPDDGDEYGDDGIQGAADDAPALGAIIVGLLVVAVLALMFAGYLRMKR